MQIVTLKYFHVASSIRLLLGFFPQKPRYAVYIPIRETCCIIETVLGPEFPG